MQFQLKQKIQVAEEDIDPTVTRSLAKSMENNGAIIGTKGELLGIIYRMKDGESLTIGRDAEKCQIVLKKSNVSREHCIVRRLDDDTYEVETAQKMVSMWKVPILEKEIRYRRRPETGYGCVMNHRNFDWDSGKRE